MRYALFLLAATHLAAQTVDPAQQSAVLETLIAKIQTGYVIPNLGEAAVKTLQTGDYTHLTDAKEFATKLTSDLRAATNDKHIAVFLDPQKPSAPVAPQANPHEQFNYGFNKIERLPGNVGYLDLRSFADPNEAKETASTWLSALANFDAIIIDVRNNGGGNTPMTVYVASYFFGPQPVHVTDMYWRDENKKYELWTAKDLPGRRSASQDLFILIGPQTFSAAEDFSYSLQQLKRATLVGGTTGGGAHMGRGLQRLSPLFTAFIPVGESLNPVTGINWENTGVQPDVRAEPADAIETARRLALERLHHP